MMCVLEGESLSVNFLFLLIFFIWTYNILQQNKLLQICPMGTVLFIFLFTAADAIQDVIANKVANKFSNFSYVFGTAHGCFHSKKILPLSTLLYVSISGATNHAGGF